MTIPTRPPPPLDTTRRYVRVRGQCHGLVEFDFAIGEPELFVELLLSPEAFAEFCETQQAIVLDTPAAAPDPDSEADGHISRLSGVGPRRHD